MNDSVKKTNFISLATKNATVYFLLILGGFSVLGYLLLKNSAQDIIQSAEQQLVHASESVELKFKSYIQDITRDIKHLGNSPYLEDFLSDTSEIKKSLLSREYLALLNSNPDYFQIRIIGVAKNGLEIIRAERKKEDTFLVPQKELQQKGNREYFLETISLTKDSIYFSIIDLNKEHDAISLPQTPTLRITFPIYRQDNLFGIIVINVDLRNLIEELKGLAGNQFNLKIVNQDGHFIAHPNPEKTFTFEYNKPGQFKNDFGFELSDSASFPSLINTQQELYRFRPLFYPRANYFLYAGVGAKKDNLLASFFKWRNQSLLIVFGLGVFILFIAFLYMKKQSKELKDITNVMTSFQNSITPTKLPIQRNDEIGQLARSFEEMSKTISKNLASLQLSKAEAEKANKEKEEFLENMSHEIRNPLHSIMGMTHLLEKNQPAPHQNVFIESLKSSTKNLLSLVNDILDFKKLSEGKLPINKTWFSLPDFMSDIISSHQFYAISRKLDISFVYPPKLKNTLIYFDSIRLNQIVNNLIVNAIKFTEKGSWIKIILSLVNYGEDTSTIRFSVIDNGIGINEEVLKKIKKRYYSKHQDKSINFLNSSGLGLSIVTQLLDLFDSELTIVSKVGEGSHFYFDLEVTTKTVSKTDAIQNIEIPTKVLADAKLLIIDDDDQILELYKHVFESHVLSFETISDCEKIQNIKHKSFHIIISDVLFKEDNISSYSTDIKKILLPDGLFYLASGYEVPKTILDSFDFVKEVFQKPVSASFLFNQICFHYAATKYGLPNPSSILEDYDSDQIKFQKAINLLLAEWKIMNKALEKAILQKDIKAYTAIVHKLITSVRRLKIDQFEEKLFSIQNELETDMNEASSSAEIIKNMMEFYIWYISAFIKSDKTLD
jgi:two-component system, sensor histidine kinase